VSEEASLGQVLAGKYVINRMIGEGGMGAVYEGEHLEIGKRVAIKIIHPTHAASVEIAERFRREARAASRVESDGIVQVFDVGRDDLLGLYMVMEFLVGEDLSQRLEREGRLPVALAVDVALQAARTLAKAHAAGVIHRDLKPANIFLCPREDGSIRVKLVDFGISKLTGSPTKSEATTRARALTRSGVVLGTPQYMSPEQAQGLPVDIRTDVWSLAAVLYETLAGRPAYPKTDTYEQTIILVATKEPAPIVKVAPWVPSKLGRLIHEAMTPSLDGRLRDCEVFAGGLQVLVESGALVEGGRTDVEVPVDVRRGASKGLVTVDGLAVAPTLRARSRHGAVVAIALGVAVATIALALGAGVLRRRGPGTSDVLPSAATSDSPAASSAGAGALPTASVQKEPPTPVASAVAATSAVPAAPSASTASVASAAPVATSPSKQKTKPVRPPSPSGGQIGGLGTTTEY
jgi:serine/threonine-protein kinase